MLLALASMVPVVAPAAANAHAVRDPAALVARARLAAGGDRLDAVRTLHLRLHVEDSGLTGSADVVVDLPGGRYARRYRLGPESLADGFDGTTAWIADASGWPLPQDAGAIAGAIRDAAYQLSGALYVPRRNSATARYLGDRDEGGARFAVLSVTPRGGVPFEEWIDRRTFLVARVVEPQGPLAGATYLSDYRRVGGMLVPFSRRSTGDRGETTVERVESAEVGAPVSASRFTAPAPPRDFTLHGAAQASVPIALASNHIYLDDVSVDGSGPFRFILDTGGEDILTPQAAQRLHLPVTKDRTTVRSLRIGGAEMVSQRFSVLPIDLSVKRGDGVQIDGMLGYQLFERFVTRIDYADRLLTLSLPAGPSAQASAPLPAASAAVVSLGFDGTLALVHAAVDGLSGSFVIDTGNRGSLDLTSPFVRAHDLVARYHPTVMGITGFSVGGALHSYVTRAHELQIGDVAVPSPVMTLSQARHGFFASRSLAGNIGGGVLRRFTVTLDYRRRELLLAPNDAFAQLDVSDRSGLVLVDADGSYRVADVRTDTPAAQAAIPVGCTLVAIDGTAARTLSLEEIREMLRGPAQAEVHLTVETTGGERRDISLVLRDYV